MIDTPRTDAAEKHAYQFKDEWTPVCESKFVRQLERELNAANDRIKQMEDARTVAAANSLANMLAYEDAVAKIKRLEEAGDAMAQELINQFGKSRLAYQWCKEKEDYK